MNAPVKTETMQDAPQTGSPVAPPHAAPFESPPRKRAAWRALLRLTLMSSGIVIVALAAAILWLRGGRYVSTDNSYVRAAKLMVSTDVSGIVASVAVKQGQQVEKGALLFKLDARQFEIALAAAQAQRDLARLSIEAARKDYQRLRSDIAAAEAVVAQARAAFQRASTLAQRNAGSQAQFDTTRFTLSAEENRLSALRQSAEAALARLGGDAALPVEQHPQFMEAQARVAESERQVERATVRAPFAGTVTSVESLQPGAFLVAATAALTNTGAIGLVAQSGMWVEANMKETELTHVRPGQECEIRIDTYPNHVWKGRVESIFPVSGAEFSVLPPQNASGNWVKVVQRIPVRIAIIAGENDPVLRAGMSAVVTVDTRHRRSMADFWRLFGFGAPPVDIALPDILTGHAK